MGKKMISFEPPFPRIPLVGALSEALGVDVLDLEDQGYGREQGSRARRSRDSGSG
ncbi:MAG: hypothetical protein Ct9H300mP15_27590 [Gemmatimonadota bacterium]|nr:MAG: hypothetical protein Ct9H300mP15_27590 [Gemmatimonadota bacterium]